MAGVLEHAQHGLYAEERGAPGGEELHVEQDEEAAVAFAHQIGDSSREQQQQLAGVPVSTSAVPAWRSSEQ
jgi:hypothetical protein